MFWKTKKKQRIYPLLIVKFVLLSLGAPPRVTIQPNTINLKEGQRMIVQYTVAVRSVKRKNLLIYIFIE